ncbi:MAG TPA: primase-helicase zinc-binding domain-containing protein [Waddliaceae bacterium]
MNLLDFAIEIGLEPKRASATHGGEYSSACPACGGVDRFRIWPNQQAKNCTGTYWCRKCGTRGDAIQFCKDFIGLGFRDASQKVGATISKLPYLRPVERQFVAPTLTPPSEKWSARSKDFVIWAHEQIWRFPDVIEQLKKRGIPPYGIKNYRIGYCDRNLWVNPLEFGIESDKKLLFPEGIVIPSIEPSGLVIRVKIRRKDRLPKYWVIRGGMNGLNIMGDMHRPVMTIVESELDAYALYYNCGDLLFAVAIGSNTKTPDNVTDYWAKRRKLLICHDNDEGGNTMSEKWQKLYPHAKSCPVPIEYGKDIGEAVEKGLDLNKWITSILN